jgi:hypothetical protein
MTEIKVHQQRREVCLKTACKTWRKGNDKYNWGERKIGRKRERERDYLMHKGKQTIGELILFQIKVLYMFVPFHALRTFFLDNKFYALS